MRVLQNGRLLARLSAIRETNDRLTAVWQGPPPPFEPSQQTAPLTLESDDGLDRREGWLVGILRPPRGEGPLRVEFGSERSAPAWHRSSPGVEKAPASGERRPAVTTEDILVVDDDPETLDLVASALEEHGWKVRRALSGREALAMAEARRPDVLIVDLIMPEIGGEQVCAELRRDARFSNTRILVLSGAEDTRMVAASCDADSAVTKPFTIDLLVREVRRLIGQ